MLPREQLARKPPFAISGLRRSCIAGIAKACQDESDHNPSATLTNASLRQAISGEELRDVRIATGDGHAAKQESPLVAVNHATEKVILLLVVLDMSWKGLGQCSRGPAAVSSVRLIAKGSIGLGDEHGTEPQRRDPLSRKNKEMEKEKEKEDVICTT
jgi:hypothetical protein